MAPRIGSFAWFAVEIPDPPRSTQRADPRTAREAGREEAAAEAHRVAIALEDFARMVYEQHGLDLLTVLRHSTMTSEPVTLGGKRLIRFVLRPADEEGAR
ncbi:MAG TPA: hypothetical protein VF041_23245 [Gemmatimonadaceae bacterium]